MEPVVGKYADMPLLITSYSDEGGRDWVTQSPYRGDLHVNQDRGLRQARTRCEIVFCDEPGSQSFADRFLAFRELARGSAPRLFVHPLLGSYMAVVADLQHNANGDERCVYASCVFVADEPPPAVFPVGAGVTAAAGPEEVGVHVAQANEQLAELGLESTTPASCLAAATAWAELEDPDARAIALEASSLAAEIDETVADLELATDLERWELWKTFLTLRYSVVRAAEATTSETARVSEYTVVVAEPLRALCARLFGAREAEERARQVAKLNGLRTPGLVPAGTALKLPAVGGVR
jgi:hypothetical protein